jgi:hypothetical protein
MNHPREIMESIDRACGEFKLAIECLESVKGLLQSAVSFVDGVQRYASGDGPLPLLGAESEKTARRPRRRKQAPAAPVTAERASQATRLNEESPTGKRKRHFSPEARARIGAAAKRMWANKKGVKSAPSVPAEQDEDPEPAPAPQPAKRQLSAEEFSKVVDERLKPPAATQDVPLADVISRGLQVEAPAAEAMKARTAAVSEKRRAAGEAGGMAHARRRDRPRLPPPAEEPRPVDDEEDAPAADPEGRAADSRSNAARWSPASVTREEIRRRSEAFDAHQRALAAERAQPADSAPAAVRETRPRRERGAAEDARPIDSARLVAVDNTPTLWDSKDLD